MTGTEWKALREARSTELRRPRLGPALMSLLLFAAISAPASAADWYVSEDGSPFNGGTSWEDAVDRVDIAADYASPGDTIHVGPGTVLSLAAEVDGMTVLGAGEDETTILCTYDFGALVVSEDRTTRVTGLRLLSDGGSDEALVAYGLPVGEMTWPRLVLDRVVLDGFSHGSYVSHAIIEATQLKIVDTKEAFYAVGGAKIRVTGVLAKGSSPIFNALFAELEIRSGVFDGSDLYSEGPALTAKNSEVTIDQCVLLGMTMRVDGGTSRVTNTVFDGALEPVEARDGDHEFVHCSFVRRSSVQHKLGGRGPVASVFDCRYAVDPRVRVLNSAVLGYERAFTTPSPQDCFLIFGNCAFYMPQGTVSFPGCYAEASPSLVDVPFALNNAYAPTGQNSPLLNAAGHPANDTDLDHDLYGQGRVWPAEIGAVEVPDGRRLNIHGKPG